MMRQVTLQLIPGERWWGGRVSDGMAMPFGKERFTADLSADLADNQSNPVLLSDKGRYVWSEGAFAFEFAENQLRVQSGGSEISVGDGFGSLREVYAFVSKSFFPSSGTYPEELLFTAPQYNLWIELLYHPTQDKVLDYARNVLMHGLPPGVIMIDDNWHEPYGNWRFHSGRFPDPKSMVDELHRMGFKVMLWVAPFVTADSPAFRALEQKGYLILDSGGQTAIRRWWNGYSAILDCTNPYAVTWLTEQLDDLRRLYGIDGFKFDAGDIRYYRESDLCAHPTTPNGHCEAWARIGLNYELNEYRACWKMAGQPLAQRLKDKAHSWKEDGLASLIPQSLAQSIMGYSYICPDMIGGGEYSSFLAHSDDLDAELIVRYAQCSALFPMMQFSAAPWRVLDGEHLSYCVEAAKLHARMAPVIMELVRHSAATGEPIIRPMEYVFPNRGYASIHDQFMLGDHILAAPVVTKGAVSRTVVFPEGKWIGDDLSVVNGPCELEIAAPLSRLPWYRREAVE